MRWVGVRIGWVRERPAAVDGAHPRACIRYRKPEGVDFAVVHALLRETANSTGPVC
jgi:hypothetical protein